MLSMREAIALYGDGWECSETGAEVRQCLRLGIDTTKAGNLLASEELAVNRAVRLLRRDRMTAQVFVDQLQEQARSIAAIPFSRLIAGKKGKEVHGQLEAEKARVAAMPEQPRIQRLNLESDTGLPLDAKKVGTSIWFFDKPAMMLHSREIKRAVIEVLDGRKTLVYQTEGTQPDGTIVRRSCAHYVDGVRTLNNAEIAFLDPIAAREYLASQKPPPVKAAAPTLPPLPAAPIAAAPPKPKAPPPPLEDPLLDHGMDESLALRPFDESMLRGDN